MTTCPTCGNPVPDNVRFCGNCGTDVQAATGFAAAGNDPAAEMPPSEAGYAYEPNPYGYAPARDRRPSTTVMVMILVGVALVCLCCGVVLGAGGLYLFSAPATGPVVPSPTPESLLHFMRMG